MKNTRPVIHMYFKTYRERRGGTKVKEDKARTKLLELLMFVTNQLISLRYRRTRSRISALAVRIELSGWIGLCFNLYSIWMGKPPIYQDSTEGKGSHDHLPESITSCFGMNISFSGTLLMDLGLDIDYRQEEFVTSMLSVAPTLQRLGIDSLGPGPLL